MKNLNESAIGITQQGKFFWTTGKETTSRPRTANFKRQGIPKIIFCQANKVTKKKRDRQRERKGYIQMFY